VTRHRNVRRHGAITSQERSARVILERLGIADVSGQRIQRLVAGHGLHLPHRRAGAGDEAGAQAVAAELGGIKACGRGVPLDQIGDRAARQRLG